MTPIVPRFEFRTFAQSFGVIGERLRDRSSGPQSNDTADKTANDTGLDSTGIDESREVYLISRDAQESNVKVRGGALEIKRLIGRHAILEQWTPTAKQPFPLDRDFVCKTLLPALAVTNASIDRDSYALDRLIADVIVPNPGLIRACVFKRRFRFQIRGCDGEIDELMINGAAIQSIAVESVDADALLDVIHESGLGEYEQVNYPLAIGRIAGLEPLPDEDQYG